MAVMAIADTAKFTLGRLHRRVLWWLLNAKSVFAQRFAGGRIKPHEVISLSEPLRQLELDAGRAAFHQTAPHRNARGVEDFDPEMALLSSRARPANVRSNSRAGEDGRGISPRVAVNWSDALGANFARPFDKTPITTRRAAKAKAIENAGRRKNEAHPHPTRSICPTTTGSVRQP